MHYIITILTLARQSCSEPLNFFNLSATLANGFHILHSRNRPLVTNLSNTVLKIAVPCTVLTRFIQKVKFQWPMKKTKALISKKYLLNYLQRFTGYFSTINTIIEACIIPVHQSLYACVIPVKCQCLKPWCHCHRTSLSLSCYRETILCSEWNIWGKWPQHSEIVKLRFCKTACRTLSISSDITRNGSPLWFLSCTLIRPSVNCLHHRLTIQESCS